MASAGNRIEPGPGQESVWDYPRPPRLEVFGKPIRIEVDGVVLVDATTSHRVLETSHPPVYYFAPEDIRMDMVREMRGASFCEWKGYATYHAVATPKRLIESAAWSYRQPTESFEAIAGHLAFYPSKMDACFVDDVKAVAQPGDFYGGWITPDIVGPFKGNPGTMGW